MNYNGWNYDSNDFRSNGSEDDRTDENYYAFKSVMTGHRPQEFPPSYFHVNQTNSKTQLDHFNPELQQSSDLLQSLEFLKSSVVIDPSLFVSNYAPTEPYTLLPLSCRSTLILDHLVSIVTEFLKKDSAFSFQAFASESVWHISYTSGNANCTMQVNIYRGRSGIDHVIEGQRCEGDGFLANSIFYGIKNAIESIEFPERDHIKAVTTMDFMRLISV